MRWNKTKTEQQDQRGIAGATEVQQLNPSGSHQKTEHQAPANLIESFMPGHH